MLDAWIIEEIRRREERERREDRPYLELPLLPPPMPDERESRDEKEKRGVVIIDYRI